MDDSIQGIDEYTQVKVYLYLINIEAPAEEPRQINIYVNGAWLTPQNIPMQTPTAWRIFTWAGLSGNQASLDDLRVKVETFLMIDDKFVDDLIRIGTMYAAITYTIPTGYGHNFLGVNSGDIDEVCGVPTANIDKINGV